MHGAIVDEAQAERSAAIQKGCSLTTVRIMCVLLWGCSLDDADG